MAKEPTTEEPPGVDAGAAQEPDDEAEEEERRPTLERHATDTLSEKLGRRGAQISAHFRDGAEPEDEDDEDHGGHGHGAKPPSILTACASALINFLLMFGLCCAYGMIMFEDDWNARHRGLGVKINLATALVTGVSLCLFSKVPVAIGGPDLNPVVFLGMLAQTIAKEVAAQHGFSEAYPEGGKKACPGAPKTTFCEGGAFTSYASVAPDDLQDFADAAGYAAACDLYHEEVRATVIFMVSITSAILGLVLVILGRFKLTRFLSYIPTNIMEAFLACIGYKVFKYALKFCKYEPKQFLPAACVGVPLYFVKALHLGNPALVIPLMLLIPLGIYYAIVFGALQEDLDQMRKEKWMFGKIENENFWSLWEHGIYMSYDRVNWKAVTKALGDLPVMVIVCTLDCALKLFNTDAKLPVKTDKDYEIQLYGTTNVLTTLCGSSVGYMQLKFNVINYGVMGNAIDRRGGLMYALLCGLCFFWTTDPFNYLPRFFLSTLLFFAGAGFLAENLWGSRKFLSTWEWLQVLVIIALFVLSGSLLLAVIVGGLIAACSFVINIAKVPAIVGNEPLMGNRILSHIRRPPADSMCMQHLSQHWLLVMRLKGFLFFGSAQQLGEVITKRVKETEGSHKCLRFIILDFTMVDGLDASAAKCLLRVVKVAAEHHIRIFWCGVGSATVLRLNASGTISNQNDLFDDLGMALAFVEGKINAHITGLQDLWMEMSSEFATFHKLMSQHSAAEPFQDILTSDAVRLGCPWGFCSHVTLKKYETVLWRPGECTDLFLVHSGGVGFFASVPEDADGEWGKLLATYRRGSFLNCGAVGLHDANCYWAVALEDGEALCWSQAQMHMMSEQQPAMAAALQRAALLQETLDAKHESVGPYASPINVAPVAATRSFLPANLQRLQAAIATAQWLERLGMFAAVDPADAQTKLPPLPKAVREELRIAFATFAENGRLDASSAGAALQYAGLFDCVLREESQLVLSEADFLELGNEAAMVRLSKSQEASLQAFFGQHAKSDDRLEQKAGAGWWSSPGWSSPRQTGGGRQAISRGRLAELFEENIGQGECLDVVTGVANIWAGNTNSDVDLEIFAGIMSRTARLHVKHWRFLDGFRRFVKTHASPESGGEEKITAEMLMAASQSGAAPLDLDKAEELLRIAGFVRSSSSSDEDSVGVFDVACIAAVLLSRRAEELPPKPRRPQAPLAPGGGSTSCNVRQLIVEDDELWIRRPTKDTPSGSGGKRVPAPNSKMLATGRSMAFDAPAAVDPTTCAAKVHVFLENPESGKWARLFSLLMALLIMASVLTLVLEPLATPDPDPPKSEQMFWFALDGFFSIVFTIELLLRFAVAPALGEQTHCGFMKVPLNVADVVAVLPWYIDCATMGTAAASEFRLLRVARLMRLARVVRLGRLAKKCAVVAPIAVILIVIWGIFLKNGLSSTC